MNLDVWKTLINSTIKLDQVKRFINVKNWRARGSFYALSLKCHIKIHCRSNKDGIWSHSTDIMVGKETYRLALLQLYPTVKYAKEKRSKNTLQVCLA